MEHEKGAQGLYDEPLQRVADRVQALALLFSNPHKNTKIKTKC
jgi:hypothetical protein